MKPNKVIVHWTGGSYTPNATDLKAYHFVIDGKGNVHAGRFDVMANCKSPLRAGTYAAHTRGANSNAIGISIAAMAGAKERPLDYGKYPITRLQWDVLVASVAGLCNSWDIPVTAKTVLLHSEVQATLGVEQKNKWDINHLHWVTVSGSTAIGSLLREQVRALTDTPSTAAEPVVVVSAREETKPAPKETAMHGIKNIFASKTIWGAAMSAVGKLAAVWFGSEAAADGVTQLLTQAQVLLPLIASFVGDALAVFGRVTATKKIG